MNDQSRNKPVLWYIKKHEKVSGPFPARLIGSYLILKRIDIDTLVSVDKVKWISIIHLPSLIPDEIKNAHSIEGQAGLHKARLREDERRGDNRRSDSDHRDKERTSNERRDLAGRRQNNEEVSSAYLKLKADFSAQSIKVKNRRIYGLIGVVIVVAALVIGYVMTDPIAVIKKTDCAVKAANNIDWQSCNKTNIDLIAKSLSGSNLHSTIFNDASMAKADLSFVNLSYASLVGANLSHAKLQRALLVGANLNSANLSYTDLSAADLSYADLRNAIISNVLVENTRFDNALWTDGRRCMRPSIDRCVFETAK